MGARRRSIIGAGMESAAKSLGSFFEGQAKDQDILDRQTQDDLRGATNAKSLESQRMMDAIMEKLFAGNPNSAAKYAGVNIDPRDMMNPILQDMGKAKTPNELMTPEEAVSRLRASGGDTEVKPGVQFGRGLMGESPDVNELTNTLAARTRLVNEEANKPTGTLEQVSPDGSKRAVPFNPRTLGQAGIQTGLSGGDQGKVEAEQILAGKLDPRVVKGEVGKAGKIAFAEASNQGAGHAPYEKPEVFINKDGPIGGKWNAKTQKFDTVPVPGAPPAYAASEDKSKIPATVVQNNAAGNTAEVTGVKILTALHNSGLDKSDNWASPKIRQWMIGTLGADPGDPMLNDINQRANYVQAALVRTLMQGRPSKYLAELYTKHLPSATQSPKLLAHQLRLALEENAMNRTEMQKTYKDLPSPSGGMTLDDFIKGTSQPSALDILRQRAVRGPG